MDSSLNGVTFSIGDAETPADDLSVAKLSSNEALVRTVEDVILGGSGADRTVTITPLSSFGAATITLTVSDGVLETSESFELVVNSPPFIEVVPDMATIIGYPFDAFELSITDDLTGSGSLLVSAVSDNQTLLPDSNIAIGAGSQADYRQFTLTLADGEFGEAAITITAEDEHGATRDCTFKVTVLEQSVNQAELVSRSSEPDSVIGNAGSGWSSISADGRYVAFVSGASNFTGYNPNGDIFVWDRETEVLKQVSAGSGYKVRPSISADGNFVAFLSDYPLAAGDTAKTWDVYVYDITADTFEQVSVTDGEAQSNAANLAPGVPYSGMYRPAISADGRYVAFISQASNLVAGDDNGRADVFVRDRTLGTTTLVSVSSNGTQANSDSLDVAMSADGAVIVFSSGASNLTDGFTDPTASTDVFVRTGGITKRVSQNPATLEIGDHNSDQPAISGDGTVVAFSSSASNLVDVSVWSLTEVLVYSLVDDVIELASVATDGTQSQGYSGGPSLSYDGRYVTFDSDSTTLTGANNGTNNVYVRDRFAMTTTLVNVSFTGDPANAGTAYLTRISGDGNFITFGSDASNIFPGDNNNDYDVFVVPRP